MYEFYLSFCKAYTYGKWLVPISSNIIWNSFSTRIAFYITSSILCHDFFRSCKRIFDRPDGCAHSRGSRTSLYRSSLSTRTPSRSTPTPHHSACLLYYYQTITLPYNQTNILPVTQQIYHIKLSNIYESSERFAFLVHFIDCIILLLNIS
jgi:hypothetical protein